MAIKWPAKTECPEVAVSEPILPSAMEIALPEPVVAAAGYTSVSGKVNMNLAQTFYGLTEENPAGVSAVFARLFWWDLDLTKDIQPADTIMALYRIVGDEVDMPVASIYSNKLKKEIKAYRFQRSTDSKPSYWSPTGEEIPYRLENSPIEDYYQITERLGGGRNHKGYDFKADVGADISSPKNGVISRVNWQAQGNGNCIDVTYSDGVSAYFLHLDEVLVKEGQNVVAGQVIAKSGNTGRSTSPHLHYELHKGSKLLEPGEYHGKFRRQLTKAEMPAFEEEIARWNALLKATQ